MFVFKVESLHANTYIYLTLVLSLFYRSYDDFSKEWKRKVDLIALSCLLFCFVISYF